MKIKLFLMLAIFILPFTGQATVPLKGYFMAQEQCPALQSIRKGTNPGNITLSKGMTYEVIGKNKANETHYFIKIKEGKTLQRWVAVSCGKLLENQNYLLAISWQPAFCQIAQQKSECTTQTKARFDAKNFSLHGLWPQPPDNIYCNVSNKDKKKWKQLPALDLSKELREDLKRVMPGVVSYLHRHEWIKHGTCYSDSPETYYRDSLALMKQINTSPVRDFIVKNIGKKVTSTEIRKKFDESFGKGAGDKVDVRCKKGMISELWINLQGKITKETRLSELMKQARSAKLGCKGGLIDPVGF